MRARRVLRAVLCAALAATAAPVLPPAAQAQTLPEAVTRAIERYPGVRVSIARQRAVVEQVDQARGALLPSIDLTLGVGRETSENATTRATGSNASLSREEIELSLTQLLFDAGATRGQVLRSEARAESAAHEVARTAEDIAQRTSLAYLDVLRLRSRATIAQQSVAVHERTFYQVQLLADSGAGRRSDVQQAISRLALAQAELASLRGQVRQAEAALRHFIGLEPGVLKPPDPLMKTLPLALAGAIESARERHPSVRAAQKALDAALADRDSLRGRLGPRLTLEAGATRNRNLDGLRGSNSDEFAMLRLRYNLYRGGSDEARLLEAEARVDEAAASLALARDDVERELRLAWETLEADRGRLPELQRHADASVEVVEAYRAQFRLGQRSLLDVLNAENERFAAGGNVVNGSFAIAAGEVRILGGTGRLLEALGVPAPEAARVNTGER